MAEDRIDWRIYYDANKTFDTFDSTEGEPWESPSWAVIAIGQPFVEETKTVLYNGYAYLYRTDWGCWMEVHDEIGLADTMVEFARFITAVRYGRTVRNSVFKRAKREVEELAGIRRPSG